MRRLIAFILAVLCCTSLSALAAQSSPTTLPVAWQSLLDDSGRSLAEIRSLPDTDWQNSETSLLSAGFTRSAAWLRTEITATEGGGHIIELSNPLLDRATLYILRADGSLETQSGGFDERTQDLKLEPYHNQVFELDMSAPGERATIYLRLSATRPLIVWPRVYADTDFYRQSFTQRLWLGTYGGVFFALSLLSLMVWITTRDRDYADFLLFIASCGLLQGHLLGLLHEQAFYRSPAVMELASLLLPVVASLAYAHFARRFLNLRQTSPRSDLLMRLCMWLEAAILPLHFIAGARYSIPADFLIGTLTGLSGLSAGIIALRQGNRAARFYLIANGILVTGGGLHVATGFNLIQATPLTLYAFPLGAGLTMIVVAFALADKVYLLQRARIQAQNDNLIAEQQIIEVLRESEAQLESRVAERTLQLEEALEQQRLQHETLERNSRAMSELHEERGAFLQIAAHDLKNPTAAIISYVDLLRERWHAWDDEKKIHRLGNVRSMAQLIFDIIRNLLDINAIESGHYALRPTSLDVRDSIQSVCDAFRQRCEVKDIHLKLELPDTPLKVMADKTALHQIVDNLVSNAIKYSPHGRSVHVRLEEESGHALIQIRDEGPGISEDDQSRLFRKFTRLSARPTGGEHSTGLGLSIVKHIVEASGGQVGCISRLGEGATFFVSLPKAG
ncbi:sensor histidine kinase [Uliginosibacterium sp. 31-16]|uniref:sensor histidine kinase n=1 Tax=Uliginosibacterium sp. 31-16 TaxID=3068315 RepID=UPI0027400ED3|nr:sensor histidine kinase [Uliginosibacterium sp. 31-16]MDP5240449.1 sensor histidine kinase [Uliginosibacterium sp. 31-16]